LFRNENSITLKFFFLFFLFNIICLGNKPPRCTFTYPINNCSFLSPASVVLKIKAEDIDGKVDTLKLLSNKTVISIVTRDELTFTLNDLGTGTYTFQAIAIDNKNYSSNISEITFFVTTSKGYSCIKLPIAQSSDDAVEKGNKVLIKTKNLNITDNDSISNRFVIIGLRFKNLRIPNKSHINHAYIQFTSGGESEEGSTLAITGHLSDHSKTFTETEGNISGRSSTFSSTSWNTYPWDRNNERGYIHQTPNLKEIIQEIVNQKSFNQTSSITLLIRGEGYNTIRSFDGDSLNAPTLVIEYRTDTLSKHEKRATKKNNFPIANFSFIPTRGRIPLKVFYNASLSKDPDGDNLKYYWDFGDGITSTEIKGKHTYTDTGTYNVILKVINSKGNLNIASIKVFATNINSTPIAKFVAKPQIGKIPLNVVFNAHNSIDPDGDNLKYYWDFGDGIISNGKREKHTYIISNNYVAKLIVSDNKEYDTAIIDIIALPKANVDPVIIFNIDTISGEPFTRLFDASNSNDPDGDDLQYIWSFGDGLISYKKIVEHTYKERGTYDVTLTILDENNKSIVKKISIEIDSLSTMPLKWH
jgi:PKD repeat protein